MKQSRLINWILKIPTVEFRAVKDGAAKIFTKLGPKGIILIAALTGLTGVVLFGGMIKLVTTHKMYCLNCHVNERNKNIWLKSKIHPDISCPSCHKTSESLIHFSFSADDDNVSANCMICHEVMKKDRTKFRIGTITRESMTINIPHQRHINDFGVKCTTCHDNIFHEGRPVKVSTYRPRMDRCFGCHTVTETPCSSCHTERLRQLADKWFNQKEGVVLRYKGPYPVKFNHSDHASWFKCSKCHPSVFKMKKGAQKITMENINASKQCGACHNGFRAFPAENCDACHVGEEI